MFGFITSIPRKLKHLFSKFKPLFTKPQYENFCRAEMGMMVAAQGEHDIKSINQLFIEYRFRESEAALVHAHLVSLACALLDTLRRRLLRYSIVRGLLSFEGTVEWIPQKSFASFHAQGKKLNRTIQKHFKDDRHKIT